MNKFNLKNNLQERIFFTNLSEIDERFDPLFYKAVERIKNDISQKSKFGYIDLIKTCKIKRGRFGHRPRNDPKFYGGEYPFIQTGDIVKASENNTSIKFTQTLNERGLKTSRLFQPPQLLFTIAANIGDTAILDYPSCFPDSIVSLIPNEKDLLIEYLNIYLKIIKSYIVDLAPYSAQKNLNNQQLAQVPVIKPPIAVQKEIISIYKIAYQSKQQKEAKAKELLKSIDDYLLKELGITQPKKDNSLKNRIFTTSLSKVSDKRFDPDYYSNYYQKLKQEIKNSIYKLDEIDTVVTVISGGKTPASTEYSDEPTEYPIIKVGSYSNEYIDLEKVDFTLTSNSLKAAKGDIFILSAAHQAEYVGRHIKYLNEEPQIETSYVGELICIRIIETECNSMFLFSLLNTEIYKTLINREKTGQTSHIYGKDIKHIKIPLPKINKQTEFANHISEIRAKAKQLEIEAKVILYKAKQDVEQILLGAK